MEQMEHSIRLRVILSVQNIAVGAHLNSSCLVVKSTVAVLMTTVNLLMSSPSIDEVNRLLSYE